MKHEFTYGTFDVPTCIRSERRARSNWTEPGAPFGRWLINRPTWTRNRLSLIEDFLRRTYTGELIWR